MEVEKTSPVCSVCGDTATCYRLYGATSVCFSCRIFFRRTVKSKQDLKCIAEGFGLCSFDKFTRSKCRKCRYEKCLFVGMNPLLVDSCKKVDSPERNGCIVKISKISTQKYIPVLAAECNVSGTPIFQANVSTEIMSDETILDKFSYAGFTMENLVQKFEEISDKVLSNPEGEYMRKLFPVDKSVIEQSRMNKEKLVVPSDYIATYKKISDSISVQFLSIFLPNFSESSVQQIASSTSVTILGLTAGLEQCFCKGSMLDQFKHFVSTATLEFWKREVPDIHYLKAIPMDAYEMMTSPWAPNIEDEEFVAETIQRLSEMIEEDHEIGELLCLLSLFSPVKIHLNSEERFCLKQFQSQISIMMYNHLLCKEDSDNSTALEQVGKVGRIVEDLYRCGVILHEGVIYNDSEDNVEDIETIEIEQF